MPFPGALLIHEARVRGHHPFFAEREIPILVPPQLWTLPLPSHPDNNSAARQDGAQGRGKGMGGIETGCAGTSMGVRLNNTKPGDRLANHNIAPGTEIGTVEFEAPTPFPETSPNLGFI